MCIYSMVAEGWRRTTPERYPWIYPNQPPYNPQPITVIPPEVTKEEVDKLRKELESLKRLIQAAKIFDEETGHPDCEVEEKVGFIRQLMELLDVDPEDIVD